MKYVVGNWKMNQTLTSIKEFFITIEKHKADLPCHAWVAPQSLHIPVVKDLAFTTGKLKVGAQDCYHQVSGAFTGEVSPHALKDMGAHFTLVGHSERRQIFQEGHHLLNQKMLTALDQDLVVIFCVGETLKERENNQTESILKEQILEGLKDFPQTKKEKLLIAYEPVWAIGTGKTATPEMANEAQSFIKQLMQEHFSFIPPVLYGGSVKPSNANELMGQKNIDGALVGGASLKAEDFLAICSI